MSAVWQTPVVVLAIMAWLAAPPKSLGEASQREALRRQMAGKSKTTLTNIGQPMEIPLVSMPPAGPPSSSSDEQSAAAKTSSKPSSEAEADKASAAKTPADKAKDEKYWRERIATAQDKVNRDVMMSQALQTRINSLQRDAVNTDDPMKQRKVREELQSMLDEAGRMQKQIEAGRKAITEIQDEARRMSVPAAWVR
jgi:hypothetical protein